MTILEAIIQAIVQGLTEFLPVSSSGHLAIVQHLTNIEPEQSVVLSAVMHLGTLVAVFIAFWSTIKELIMQFFSMIADISKGKFNLKDLNPEKRMIVMLIVAIIPLMAIYPIKGAYDDLMAQGNLIFLAVCFFVTGTFLLVAEKYNNGTKDASTMTYKDSIAIGIAQCVAIFPGVSRSGSTVSMSMFCGLSKKYAVTFSFILGIPAILAGGLLEVYDAFKSDAQFDILPMAVAFVVSGITGFFAIKLISWVIKNNNFKYFAIYTYAVGVFVLVLNVIK